MAVLLLVIRIALTLTLYAFLGWAIWTLWKGLKSQSSQFAAQRAPVIQLTAELSGGTRQQQFNKAEIIIGRDAACDYVLPDSTVSSRHAQLSFHHQQWWLQDLKSTNGTFLNEEPVHTAVVIAAEDRIRCGAIWLKIDFSNP